MLPAMARVTAVAPAPSQAQALLLVVREAPKTKQNKDNKGSALGRQEHSRVCRFLVGPCLCGGIGHCRPQVLSGNLSSFQHVTCSCLSFCALQFHSEINCLIRDESPSSLKADKYQELL